MKAILGLGNPGEEYINTRHNVGFMILDRFAEKYHLQFKPSKHDYYFASGELENFPFVLVKPLTYVNRSGESALDVLNDYKITLNDILIICDDLNLEFGKIRIRKTGGDGGHNGIASIIYSLNSDYFLRLRFGIGRNFEKGEMVNFVLSRFTENELSELTKKYDLAVELMESFILGGSETMLNLLSKKNKIWNKGAFLVIAPLIKYHYIYSLYF